MIDTSQNIVFPRAGGVEHLDCLKIRKPPARVSGDSPGWRCFVCDAVLLRDEHVVLMGHDLIHARCREQLRAIGGGSGPSARRLARTLIEDPFASAELVATSMAIRLDAADVCAMSRYLRHRRSCRRRGNHVAA